MSLATPKETLATDAVVTRIQTIQVASGLTFTPKRVYSFGFSDADLMDLQVPVRAYDTDYETESQQTEQADFQIEVGVFKAVDRTKVADIDIYFALVIAIAKLFPIDHRLALSDGTVSVVVGKRFAPFMLRTQDTATRPGIMDTATVAATRFESRLLLTLRAWVDE